MKVRHTQIDDFFEKQKGTPRESNRKKAMKQKGDDENLLTSEKEEDEKKVYRMMLQLPDFGTVISLFGIESIEKAQRFVDTENNPRFQYGIIINKGMTPSERYPKVDLETWFEKEWVRDERYEKLLANLKEAGYNIVDI